MRHVELSVSGPNVTRVRPVVSSLDRWSAAVAEAAEACLVVDSHAVVMAMSAPLEQLLGRDEPASGYSLLDEVLQVLDFADGGPLAPAEVAKTPPLLALSSGQLARGLVRVRCLDGAGRLGSCTLDAVATPLVQDGLVCGSLTFFTTINP